MKISTGPVSRDDALRFADEVEAALSEVAAGTRKAGKIPLEPVCRLIQFARDSAKPIDMVLFCANCGAQHIDVATETWPNEPHRSHRCRYCEHIWRPADVATNGVAAVKTRGKDDDPIVTPKPRVPDWDAIKDKRMSEMTPSQTADARELWLREQINDTGRSQHDFESHIVFLLRRLDEARGASHGADSHRSPRREG